MPSKKSLWGATINSLDELEPLVPKDLRWKVQKRLAALTGGDVIEFFAEEFRLRYRRGILPMVARAYVENLHQEMNPPKPPTPRGNLWD